MPVSPLILRRRGSQGGSHVRFAPTFTFQARILPEGLTMVRMLGQSHRKPISPCPLGTSYPGQLSAPIPLAQLQLGCWFVWLTLGRWASGPYRPTRLHVIILHLCSKNLSERTSVAVLPLPSSHSPSSQTKFSRHSFLPALDLERGKLGVLIPWSLPQRNWSCPSDKEFDNQKIHPRQVSYSPHLWDRTLFLGSPKPAG